MIEIIKQIFRTLALIVRAGEKWAKALENMAAITEKATAEMAEEAAARRRKISAERRKMLKLEILEAERRITGPAHQPRLATTLPKSDLVKHEKNEVRDEALSPPRPSLISTAVDPSAASKVGGAGNALEQKSRGAQDAVADIDIKYICEPAENFASSNLLCSDVVAQNPVAKINDSHAIRDFVIKRRINRLLHFTREANLGSILECGLITRDVLRAKGMEGNCNDELRLDGTDAVCASIGFPNYRMFYRLRATEKSIGWVVLVLDPKILWTSDVAFCCGNAASTLVTSQPLEARKSIAALEAMFADFGDIKRTQLGLPESYPTNPQAEVLLLDGVPLHCIREVIVYDRLQRARVTVMAPNLAVNIDQELFRWRSDYEHWKSDGSSTHIFTHAAR